MDDIVRRAMARWPDVPAVYGWLQLDERGRWLIKGDPIANPVVKAFIDRNYQHDNQGRWYFQNGPQQVFVQLAYTPYVCRIWPGDKGALMAETHTGLPVNRPQQGWLDDSGGMLIECEHGIGCVESHSLAVLADAVCLADGTPLDEHRLNTLLNDEHLAGTAQLIWNDRRLPIAVIRRRDVPSRFGFDPSPQPPAGASLC